METRVLIRTIQKFIMTEFLLNRIKTQKDVDDYMYLICKKLGCDKIYAAAVFRDALPL